MELMKAVSIRLKAIMEEKGVTATELINKYKLPSTSVYRILSGTGTGVNIESLNKILQALDITWCKFLDDELMSSKNLDDTREFKTQLR